MGASDVSNFCKSLIFPEIEKSGFERKGLRLYHETEDHWWGWVYAVNYPVKQGVSSFFLRLEFAPLRWLQKYAESDSSREGGDAKRIFPKPGWRYDVFDVPLAASDYSALPRQFGMPDDGLWSFIASDEESKRRCAHDLCAAFEVHAVPWFEERLDPARVRKAIPWSESKWFLRS